MASSVVTIEDQIIKALSQMLEEELPNNCMMFLNNNFEQDKKVLNEELTNHQ